MGKTYEVYVDGACSNNQAPGSQPGGWAVVFRDGREYCGYGFGTNQQFELRAAIEALKQVPVGASVTVYSDSAYLVNAFLHDWFSGWKRRGWMNSRGEPVANRDLWEELLALAAERHVQWVKVKGHAGDPFNERADELARRMAKEAKKQKAS